MICQTVDICFKDICFPFELSFRNLIMKNIVVLFVKANSSRFWLMTSPHGISFMLLLLLFDEVIPFLESSSSSMNNTTGTILREPPSFPQAKLMDPGYLLLVSFCQSPTDLLCFVWTVLPYWNVETFQTAVLSLLLCDVKLLLLVLIDFTVISKEYMWKHDLTNEMILLEKVELRIFYVISKEFLLWANKANSIDIIV